jgi:hypothetical protein
MRGGETGTDGVEDFGIGISGILRAEERHLVADDGDIGRSSKAAEVSCSDFDLKPTATPAKAATRVFSMALS